MRSRNYLILTLFMGLSLLGCSKNGPKPCFEMSSESMKQLNMILVGEDVLLSNCTEGALSFTWDFGDGETSTGTSPHHVWKNPGNYTLTLYAENENGIKNTSEEITVQPSLFGKWEGEYQDGENQVAFTYDLEQSGNKIKGGFWTAGPFAQYGSFIGQPKGVLSSNSIISGDSVKMDGALIYSFGGQSISWMYKFEGIVNTDLDRMDGEVVMVNGTPKGPWSAVKK